MAVAGLHKASGLDSYLGNKERSTTRTSSIRKMWRDLENGRRQTSGVIIDPESPCSSSMEAESMESEIENECPQNQNQNQMVLEEKDGVRKSFGGHRVYSSSRLNNECKRVRIVREWIDLSTQQGETSRTNGSEESTTPIGFQTDGTRSPIRRIYGRQALLDLLAKFVRERKSEVDDLVENRFVSNFAHRHRIQTLLKGRFLRNQKFVQDEKPTSVAASELGFLRRTNAVSDIRKGFLTRLNNYGHAAQSDSDTSSGDEMNNYDHVEQAAEVVQETPHEISENFDTTNLTSNRESHNPPEPSPVGAVHDNNILQYEQTLKPPLTADHSPRSAQSDSDTSSENDMTNEHTEQVVVGEEFERTNPQEYARSDSQSDSESDSSTDNDINFDHIDQTEEVVHQIPSGPLIPQESHDGGWYLETVGSDLESHEEEWYGNDNDDVVLDPPESWFGGNSSYLEAALVRSNTFDWSDDDHDDNGSRVVELRELTNRRSVSNLLQSNFGARLERLMQSYVNRQDQSFESENEWMQDQDQSPAHSASGIDASPQTLGEHDLHGAADNGFTDSDFHLSTEWEIINGLRIDMDMLEQKMNDMQKMLEGCMDMQIELQRSVQQEIHSALNVDCFLCCDDESESLPNRSAQMLHICSKCAQKVNWSKLKESVRHP